ATQLDPKRGRAWHQLGVAYLRQKHHGRARDAFERARPILGADPDLICDLARLKAIDGKPDEAIRMVKEVQAQSPRAPRPHLELGNLYRLNGRCKEAAVAYRAYLKLRPDASGRENIERSIASCK